MINILRRLLKPASKVVVAKSLKKGAVVRWSGKKAIAKTKTNALGIVVKVHPFRYNALNYDVSFSNNEILTCHKSDLEIISVCE